MTSTTIGIKKTFFQSTDSIQKLIYGHIIEQKSYLHLFKESPSNVTFVRAVKVNYIFGLSIFVAGISTFKMSSKCKSLTE